VSAVPAKLYGVPASHPCACVEAALRLKGVEYRRIDLVPVAHKALQQLRFGAATVPGIVFEGGEKVAGSRPIIRALEHRAPDPPLLPRDARERRPVEEAEEWGDEVLQPLVRRIIWRALVRRPGAIPSYSADSRLPIPAPVARLSAPLIARTETLIHRAGDLNVRADLVNLDWHLDRADGWVEDGTMGGDRPNAADLQVGAGLALLRTLEDLAPRIDARPCGALARRWFPDYPGRTPAGTLPAEWLAVGTPAA
jgi:glutathione S-transferase